MGEARATRAQQVSFLEAVAKAAKYLSLAEQKRAWDSWNAQVKRSVGAKTAASATAGDLRKELVTAKFNESRRLLELLEQRRLHEAQLEEQQWAHQAQMATQQHQIDELRAAKHAQLAEQLEQRRQIDELRANLSSGPTAIPVPF